MKRIAVGGFRHETNTFAPTKAGYAAFAEESAEPSPLEGEALLHALAGANVPMQGSLDTLRAAGCAPVPLVWASASPSAHVTQDAYERIAGRLIDTLRAAGPVDGVVLDLHGAMVADHLDDGEGELLARVRAVVGERVPVVASLDLHANVTRRMVAQADALTIFRTYPHVDMAETGARAAQLLLRMLASGRRLHKGMRAFDFLTTLPQQCTLIEPLRGLYADLAALQARSGVALDFAPGFPMADIAECGMALVGYGDEAAGTESALGAMARAIEQAEPRFAAELLGPDEAVRRALRDGAPGAPVVLADTQDNPGVGGNGDTTGLLEALVRQGARGAVLGLLVDPAAAARAHALGPGAAAAFSLGALSGLPGHRPFEGRFVVERLGDGRLTCTGPMFLGLALELGPMACLRHEATGVRVVVSTLKFQAADQALFRHVGIEPAAQTILALKSSVHFRADFEPLARAVHVVKAPGPALVDPVEFAWKKLRPGIRLRPMGPVWRGRAAGPAGPQP
jgi:microcystin degradation protein MlrC